MKKQEKEKIWK